MPSDLIAPILIIVSCINMMLAVVILARSYRELPYLIFGLMAVSTGLWGLAIWGFFADVALPTRINWIILTHGCALVIAFLFCSFSSVFPRPILKHNYGMILLMSVPFFTVMYFLIMTKFIIGNTEGLRYELFGGYYVYEGLLLLYFLGGYYLLWRRLREAQSSDQKQQIKYILIGSIVSSLLALVTDMILPMLGVFEFTWLGPIFTLVLVSSIFIAISRYRLFNIKIITTEIFVLVLSVVFFARIFSSQELSARVVDVIIFVTTAFFGILLVRSVKEEVRAREELHEMAKRLTETNWELAKTNERLRVMDQRKSEFVSIVSHQLRTPITAIKGYTSLLLEDAYGVLSTLQKTQVEKIFISSNRLAEMVNDFLDISKIEQGTMKYEVTEVDVKKMLIELFGDFLPVADAKGLSLDFTCSETESFKASADGGKLRQIFSNILDNAIKYTPKGAIMVSLENNITSNQVVCKVKDSGIGLSQDDLHHLFGKFTRGSQGQSQNTDGSGLGLYIAQKMLEAMKGKIWVDSEGPSKGSTFVIVLSKG